MQHVHATKTSTDNCYVDLFGHLPIVAGVPEFELVLHSLKH